VKTLIETERLLLREITLDDKEELLRLYSNPEVQKYTDMDLADGPLF